MVVCDNVVISVCWSATMSASSASAARLRRTARRPPRRRRRLRRSDLPINRRRHTATLTDTPILLSSEVLVLQLCFDCFFIRLSSHGRLLEHPALLFVYCCCCFCTLWANRRMNEWMNGSTTHRLHHSQLFLETRHCIHPENTMFSFLLLTRNLSVSRFQYANWLACC